jgi:hypothetical protein
MNTLSKVYRRACREINLPENEKRLLLKLIREIGVNIVRRQKTWHVKADFITLWFISTGRFPELAAGQYGWRLIQWVAGLLPFELEEDDIRILLS